ncbi:MAG: putative ABC transporter permease [Bacilli bacterium]|nr:putative ABC transporter permease [Bacilli bacterium]
MEARVKKSRDRLFYIFMFFSVAIVGWLWEGIYDLLQFGVLANHGVLFGPWEPIYGSAAVFLFFLLNRFKKHPFVVFMGSFVFCTLIEYGTGLYLETTKGMTWWTYKNIPFNIDGRICLMSSIVFGLGGVLLIYFIAPRLRKLFDKLDYKRSAIMILVLMSIYTIDFIYSTKHPNIVIRHHVINPPLTEVRLFKK